MRILHIITALNTGGAERMLVKLIQATHKDFEYYVITLSDKGTQGKILEELGIPVYELEMKGLFPGINVVLKLRRYLNIIMPDLIQGWMYHGNLAATFASFIIRNIPVVYNVRHSLYSIKLEKKTTRLIIRLNSFFSKKADGVIYNSITSKEQHENFGFSAYSSITIPNGFDIIKYRPNKYFRSEIRKEFQISENEIVFGQIGRNHPMKDHQNFIKAAFNVLKEKKNCHFLLVGEGIDENKELLYYIDSFNISDSITLLGQRSDIERIWNSVDIGVLSSAWGEGFPNVIGEAMACAKPCVVTDVGDALFIVGKTGEAVPSRDPEKLGKAMMKMADLKEEDRLELGEKARMRIIDNFSIEQISKRYLEYYQRILQTK